jgi:hypothetical protein
MKAVEKNRFQEIGDVKPTKGYASIRKFSSHQFKGEII